MITLFDAEIAIVSPNGDVPPAVLALALSGQTEAGTATPKVSLADSPLVSVAVTLRVRLSTPAGTVPENVSVAALKLSQEGSA